MNDDLGAAAQRAVEEVRSRVRELDGDALDLLFREARSHNAWQDKPVGDDQLRAIYDVMRMGPTSSNCCPARFRFLRSAAGKERLRPAIVEANIEKTMTAPVVAIIGHDLDYWRHLDRLQPLIPDGLRAKHRNDVSYNHDTAFRNGSLQGAYFVVVARALGLDTGTISGFDNTMVDELFFAGTQIKSNFICNLGYGEASRVHGKFDRLDFDDVCEIL